MTPRSIRGRLLLWTGALTLVALAAAYLTLSALLEGFVTRRLAAELAADARGIMAFAEWDAAGQFTVAAPPPDARFETPLSGWYWQVTDGTEVLARAPGLVTGDLGTGGTAATGPDGAALMTHLDRFTAPGDSRDLTVTVTLPEADRQAELAAIRRPLGASLAVLGALLLLAQGLAVRLGLTDLARFAAGVAEVRAGRRAHLPPPRAVELQPLAAELDRLLVVNAEAVARARAHAGDLAHALKTPLAVLANRAPPADRALLDRMDRTLRWHLKRARAVGAGQAAHVATPVAPVLEDLVQVLRPEALRRDITLRLEVEGAPDFRGDAEDLAEMLGNLAENAVKWAALTVRMCAFAEAGALVFEVCDDGPGIPAEDRQRLLARGARLDEGAPGHGLGLAIVADRVALYGGTLTLEEAPEGGLCARLRLPAAEAR
ncbi:MAG TPA: sensor histidine kinase [Citreicella sp.]|nr:sensor histidine kinase [Citreicella sp.]